MLPCSKKFDKMVWPVGIACTLGLFLAIQVVLVFICGTHFDGPDQVDYYRIGLDYSREVKRQEAQRALGWRLNTNLPAQLKSCEHFPLQVEAKDRGGRHLQGEMWISLRQPATKRLDRKVDVVRQGDKYLADLTLSPGVWDVTMEFHANSFRWLHTDRIFVTR